MSQGIRGKLVVAMHLLTGCYFLISFEEDGADVRKLLNVLLQNADVVFGRRWQINKLEAELRGERR